MTTKLERLAIPVRPGLLRRCTPVIAARALLMTGVVLGPVQQRPGALVRAAGNFVQDWGVQWDYGLSSSTSEHDLELDLTDATGRAHAAWALAEQLEPEPSGPVLPPWCVGWMREGVGGWVMSGRGQIWLFCGSADFKVDGLEDAIRVVVPSLSSLVEARIPRLLPDGSRWSDAEALRRVYLHYAETSP